MYRHSLLSLLGASVLPPVNSVAPSISGTLNIGQTLTAANGTWTGAGLVYTYQWKRGGVDIGGATASTYATVLADLGATITVTVTVTNAGGQASATSAGVVIFTPSSISGQALWLQADSIGGLNDGDTITTWTDLVGSYAFTQASSTLRPTYKTSILNGLPIVRFDGATNKQLVYSGGAVPSGSSSVTLFAVINLADSSRRGQIIKVGSNTNSPLNGYAFGVGLNTLAADGNEVIGLYEGVRFIDTNTTYGTGGHSVTMQINGSGVPSFWRDGTSLGSFSGTNMSAPATTTVIGGVTNNSAFRVTTFDIAEIIAYSAILGATDRASVEAYLKAKWGTP